MPGNAPLNAARAAVNGLTCPGRQAWGPVAPPKAVAVQGATGVSPWGSTIDFFGRGHYTSRVRFSQALIPTLREVPSEAEICSHQLMLRAGMIRQVARGIYDYLPLGWRVLKKVIQITREELDRAGCQEVQLPIIIPAELWQETGRWTQYGKELLRLKDRSDREFCFGPTHEEVITDLVRREVRSYRQLPMNLYQIHTKFRDEVRPRFGLMRGREFLMKDGYSFHASTDDLDRHYLTMCETYQRIFARCGLKSCVVEAATGTIGGSSSHEVVVLAETGESSIAICDQCHYSANVEMATARPTASRQLPVAECESPATSHQSPQSVHTPGLKTIDEVAPFLHLSPASMIKTIVYLRDGGVVAALVGGPWEVHEAKLQAATGAAFLALVDAATMLKITGAAVGFAGPVGLPRAVDGLGPVTLVADPSVMALAVGATGANRTDYHLTSVVPGRDFIPDLVTDIRMVIDGDGCPRCTAGTLRMARGIEVGHIFKLGTKYSAALKAVYLDETGTEQAMIMGTYGIGIGRTAAAAIEQHHDAKGIIWPMPIAPFHVELLVLKNRDPAHVAFGDTVYTALREAGIEVLYDDRDERAGVKFADADLIGIPYQLVVGSKGIAEQRLEVKERRGGEARLLTVAETVAMVKAAVSE